MAVNRVDYGGNTLIDLTGDTLESAEQLLKGIIAHAKDGSVITGLMEAGGGFEVSTGIITPSESVSSISWEHGLSKAPSFVLVFLEKIYSYSRFANHLRMYFKRYNKYGNIVDVIQPYVSKNESSTLVCSSSIMGSDNPFTIDDNTVTAGESAFASMESVKTWCAGKPYSWICIAGDIIFPKA